MNATPASAQVTPRRRVQQAIESALRKKITGIPVLVLWDASGAVLDAIITEADVRADIDHLIRQERLVPDTRLRTAP